MKKWLWLILLAPLIALAQPTGGGGTNCSTPSAVCRSNKFILTNSGGTATITYTGGKITFGAAISASSISGNGLTATGGSSASLTGNQADGATSVGVILNNNVTLANAAAKLFDLRNNGTSAMWMLANGNLVVPANVYFGLDGTTTGTPNYAMRYASASTRLEFLLNGALGAYMDTTNGGRLAMTGGFTALDGTYGFSISGYWNVYGNASRSLYVSSATDGASTIAHRLDTGSSFSTTGAKLLSVQNNGTEKFGVSFAGAPQLTRTDTSGSPGNATANTASGKSAVAAAASSVVITNSLVTTNSLIFTQPVTADTTCVSLTATSASGSFTATCKAAATGNTTFYWWIVDY